jgi:hypothetical protein
MGCWGKTEEEEPEAKPLVVNGTENVVNESGGFHIIEIHQATAGNLGKAAVGLCCCCMCGCGILACMYRVYRRGCMGALCPPRPYGQQEPYRGASWSRGAPEAYFHPQEGHHRPVQLYPYDLPRFQELPPERVVTSQPREHRHQVATLAKPSPPMQRSPKVEDLV